MTSSKFTTCLWFKDKAEEAAVFYTSVFPGSRLGKITRYTKEGMDIHRQEPGSVMTVDFEINGMSFIALNGSPEFKFNESFSLQIFCDTQEEIDFYWSRLTEGGEESQCGWLKDKFGFSWQVVPSILPSLLSDPSKAEAAIKVMMPMRKLIIEDLLNA